MGSRKRARWIRSASQLLAIVGGLACSAKEQTSRPALAATEGSAAVSGTEPNANKPLVRIEPLGDSITEITCQSQLLSRALRDLGHPNFDLVGTVKARANCGVSDPDRDCEGHSGYCVSQIVGDGSDASQLPVWCAKDHADIVLMHFGTNDIWHDHSTAQPILSAYSLVVAALRAVQPRVVIFVAQIIPAVASDCPQCATEIQALNAAIPNWAEALTSEVSPIYVVDQWTGFDPRTDSMDGVHPNLQGSQKMANAWAQALLRHGLP